MRINIAKPTFQADGVHVRKTVDWQTEGRLNGSAHRRKGARTARRHAEEYGVAVMLWNDGRVTLYVTDREGDIHRHRWAA